MGRNDTPVGAMVEKALQLVDVVVEDGQQLATAARLEKGHLQPLQVVVTLQTQFVLHRLGQVAPKQAIKILKQRFGGPDHKRKPCQQGQLGGHRLQAEGGQPGGVPLHHHVHGQADQDRWGEVEQLVEDGAERGQDDGAPMGPELPQQPSQPRGASSRRGGPPPGGARHFSGQSRRPVRSDRDRRSRRRSRRRRDHRGNGERRRRRRHHRLRGGWPC